MEDGATHVIIGWHQSSSWGRDQLLFIKKENYWAGQNICLDFYDCAYGKIQMNFLANPIFEISLTIQVCERPCTLWKAGSWGRGFSSSPQHICTHAHPRDISCCCCHCWVASVVSDSVRPHRRQPTRLPSPWDSPGKNTGVGCHFLPQCMKVKSESEVAQSCPTLSDPVDCSPPGSSIHGISQARVLE